MLCRHLDSVSFHFTSIWCGDDDGGAVCVNALTIFMNMHIFVAKYFFLLLKDSKVKFA